jgi:bifunctional DNase/RNase
MWGNDIARPITEFVRSKMEQKQPAAHYLLQDVMAMLDQKVALHLDSVNPDTFAATRRYTLLVMEAK